MAGLELAAARVHEVCGPARRTLALAVADGLTGPVIWIAPLWMAERLNPDGMAARGLAGRLIFATPRRAEDLLWSMEEALRSGTVPLVVADLPEPPSLTPVRRLHLAAEAGAGLGKCLPLGLILTPAGGAPGVESRGSLKPARTDTATPRWEMQRLRARTAPEAAWQVTCDARGGLRPAGDGTHENVTSPCLDP
jgi:protein ImuA